MTSLCVSYSCYHRRIHVKFVLHEWKEILITVVNELITIANRILEKAREVLLLYARYC